jgi:hypothetical protein
MRFRPGSLTEASAIFAIAFLLSLITFVISWKDFQYGFNNALLAVMLLMMPSYTITAIATAFYKYRTSTFKFFLDLGVLALVSIAGLFLYYLPSGSAGISASDAAAMLNTILVFFFTSSVSAAATQFWLVDNDGPRFSFRKLLKRNAPMTEREFSAQERLALTKPAAKKNRKK